MIAYDAHTFDSRLAEALVAALARPAGAAANSSASPGGLQMARSTAPGAAGQHHAQRLLRRLDTHVESRVICAHRGGAGQHRAALRTRSLCASARASSLVAIHLLAPLARAWPSRLTADLTRTKGRPWRMRMQKAGIERRGFALQQSRLHGHAGLGQAACARAVDARVRIANGVHHAAHAGGQQHIDAWRCAPKMVAGLERDVGRGAACTCTAAGSPRVRRGLHRVDSCQPSPTISLSRASTAPTRGFGTCCTSRAPRVPARGAWRLRRMRLIPFTASSSGFWRRFHGRRLPAGLHSEVCRDDGAGVRFRRGTPRRPESVDTPRRNARTRLHRACAAPPSPVRRSASEVTSRSPRLRNLRVM